ncbi:MAG TPA: SUMF1/EgtB/PvdO family nonheme iron enzyme [Bacteroidales bacterium]|nr:SUMF1/EgtB/PvdO family nonheme iron enzyme [Bacteroidales bacterium]
MTKVFYFLLIFLVTVLSVSAQDLREMRLSGEPQKSETEIVSRRDNNGNFTAAIMVISDMEGFSYDAYNGVVGNVDSRPGMDLVHVQATERVLEIYKTGYRPLKIILSEVGISLRPQEVWQITITGDAPPAATLPVTIRITPADASLTIDGKPAAGTTHSLTPGSHTLKIEIEGFKTEEKNITVSEKQVFFEFALQHQPDAGLQIETTPGGASVYLDGVKLGETPLAVFYKPDTYPIRIVKEGYVTLENQTLEVALPQTRKSFTLEENVGYLTINTHSGASVYFNDQLIANPKNVKLPPQLVKVKVTMPKAEPMEQQVVLKRNDRLTFDLYPQVQTGTIQIAVTPFDAQIELTGDTGEKYTATGMKVFEDIPRGTYIVKVSAAGYDPKQEIIKLKTGERLNSSIRINPNVISPTTKIKPTTKSTTILTSTYDYGIEMVFVKGGTFTMGCTNEQGSNCDDDEKPAHRVLLRSFFISKFEITQKQWFEITDHNHSFFEGCDECPVENVSWKEVQEFIEKLNHKTGKKYRLPTEAEWEFAARGGITACADTATKFAGSDDINEVAWYSNNSNHSKVEIISGNVIRVIRRNKFSLGDKSPNCLGIFDMSGNVWEWCSDWYGEYNRNLQTNPIGPFSGSYRIIRGGSWDSQSNQCRITKRDKRQPSIGANNIGFRLVQDI